MPVENKVTVDEHVTGEKKDVEDQALKDDVGFAVEYQVEEDPGALVDGSGIVEMLALVDGEDI
eukprot:4016993-Prorocentrum_lima.AAC.1